MKHIFYFLFFIFAILVSAVSIQAVGFSPTKLDFELGQDEIECQTITLNSDSERIVVLDKWAESSDVELRVGLLNVSSDFHGLSVDYDSELIGERELDVCLSGRDVGEYRGILLMREEQKGNSVVQMGVWLKVVISEEDKSEVGSPKSEVEGPSSGSSLSGSSSSGGGSIPIKVEEVVNESSDSVAVVGLEVEESEEEFETSLDKSQTGRGAGITGAVVGGSGSAKYVWVVVLVVLVGLGLVYSKRRKN